MKFSLIGHDSENREKIMQWKISWSTALYGYKGTIHYLCWDGGNQRSLKQYEPCYVSRQLWCVKNVRRPLPPN